MKSWMIMMAVGLVMVGLGLWAVWQTHSGPEWGYWSIAGMGASLVLYSGVYRPE